MCTQFICGKKFIPHTVFDNGQKHRCNCFSFSFFHPSPLSLSLSLFHSRSSHYVFRSQPNAVGILLEIYYAISVSTKYTLQWATVDMNMLLVHTHTHTVCVYTFHYAGTLCAAYVCNKAETYIVVWIAGHSGMCNILFEWEIIWKRFSEKAAVRFAI